MSQSTINNQIKKIIREKGYISIAEFTEIVIPFYYQNNHSIGSQGDFITSPEISQLFGEIIGIWTALKWQELGSPDNFSIVELGPGKGTLLKDLLRATANIKNFHQSLQLNLIETSEKLKNIQKENLIGKVKNITWHKNLTTLPNVTSIFIANEFFDALPINQYIKIKKDWYEKIITTLIPDGDLCFSEIPINSHFSEQLNYDHPNATNRAIVEISPLSIEYIKKICNFIKINKGYGLIIDYGYDFDNKHRTLYNSTLQAIMKHNYHPILHDIGRADITAHVDFNSIKQSILNYDCKFFGTITQKEFLLKYGIIERANSLTKNLDISKKNRILSGLNRLISINEMGKLFKVLEISS